MGLSRDAEPLSLPVVSQEAFLNSGIEQQGRQNNDQGSCHQPLNEGGSTHKTPNTELLSLPFELQQRILEYVFAMPSPGSFPPRRSPIAYGKTPSSSRYLTTLLLCRQIYTQARLLPFRTNLVSCPATFGSNTTTTRRFLKSLRSFQRNAIRRLELTLLASMVDTWSLISILRLLANAAGENELQDTPSGPTPAQDQESARETPLQALTINIGTRDLYLAQAESLTGLTHMLDLSTSAPTYLSCASWVIDGLVHLKALRRLTIVVEMSGAVAQRLEPSRKDQFQQVLDSSLPWVSEIRVEWKVVDDRVAKTDDNDWVDSSWSHEQAAMLFTHGASHDAYDEDLVAEEARVVAG
ncbi:hypothetical protein EDD37DRAFT_610892 [Exophiala viscosa]|uniref:uncharacterized protein n=1 Tax=Exophiala viscosa TaxID=2486360 RepID=UPI002198D88C|nr:hypothetical protein EDD37DRAFT_610892 [Exophiala viscosa]